MHLDSAFTQEWLEQQHGLNVHVLDLPSRGSEHAFVKAFMSRSEVEFAELDQLFPAEQMIPDDPYYSNPNAWHLQKISASGGWAVSTGSP